MAGVVDGLFAKVVPGIHMRSKLDQQLNQVNVIYFGRVMECSLVSLSSIHICTLEKQNIEKDICTVSTPMRPSERYSKKPVHFGFYMN